MENITLLDVMRELKDFRADTERRLTDLEEILMETREVVNIIGAWCERADDVLELGYPVAA